MSRRRRATVGWRSIPSLLIVTPSYRIDREALMDGVIMGRDYVVLGEVGETDHYILLDIERGEVLPGMWHDEDFDIVDSDEYYCFD